MAPSTRCRVEGCEAVADVPGAARGYCVKHYTRWLHYGNCEAASVCDQPATSHLGLCDAHTPAGILS